MNTMDLDSFKCGSYIPMMQWHAWYFVYFGLQAPYPKVFLDPKYPNYFLGTLSNAITLQDSRGHPTRPCHWVQYFHTKVEESGWSHCCVHLIYGIIDNLTKCSPIRGPLVRWTMSYKFGMQEGCHLCDCNTYLHLW